MKKFLIQSFLFFLPIIAVLSIPFFVLFVSKENFHNIDYLLKSNNKEKYLIGYAYNQDSYGYLKYKYISNNEQKDILTLGSSRILQFREQMFKNSFYNAGYTVSSIKEFQIFMNLIKGKYPKILIISLDQWMFNKNWPDHKTPKSPSYYKSNPNNSVKFQNFLKVYRDIFAGKIKFDLLTKTNENIKEIGLSAKFVKQGYFNDGSMFYGVQIDKLLKKDKTSYDFEFNETINRITKGIDKFEYSSEVNEEAFDDLNKFLKFCYENKIYVVSFLPPYSKKVYDEMLKSGKYSYLGKINEKVKPIVEKYGFEFYDFSLTESINSSDTEFLDGFHGSEVTYLKLLITMIKSNSALSKYCDLNKLETDLNNAKNSYIVYP